MFLKLLGEQLPDFSSLVADLTVCDAANRKTLHILQQTLACLLLNLQLKPCKSVSMRKVWISAWNSCVESLNESFLNVSTVCVEVCFSLPSILRQLAKNWCSGLTDVLNTVSCGILATTLTPSRRFTRTVFRTSFGISVACIFLGPEQVSTMFTRKMPIYFGLKS